MQRVNNTAELVEYIKTRAEKKKNWQETEGVVGMERLLHVFFAFGLRREDDVKCTSSDFHESGIMSPPELKASQEEKDIPREKYTAKKASVDSKNKPIQVKRHG